MESKNAFKTVEMIELLSNICKTVGFKIGKGFSENVYQEGISLLCRKQNIEYSKEVVLPITLDDVVIGNVRADIVFPVDKIVIECKAIDSNLKPSHAPQLINYLEILKYDYGILVNFNQNPSKDFVEVVVIHKVISNNTNDNVYSVNFTDKVYLMSNNGLLIE